MADLLHVSAAVLRHYATPKLSDPVAEADRYTSMCDARIGVALAAGHSADDVDPTTGYSYSRRSYDAVRQSWVMYIKHHGLSTFTRPWLVEARAKWAANRPQFIEDDDWEAEGVELHLKHWAGRGRCGPSCEVCPE